jgi:hypothetical protein
VSFLHNTGARLASWALRHTLLLTAFAVTLAFIGVVLTSTFRFYDERQAQLRALRDVTVSFCEGGNDLRAALRAYVAETIVLRSVPDDADAAMAAEIEARNRQAQAALDRAERTFAPRDCAALARTLNNPD